MAASLAIGLTDAKSIGILYALKAYRLTMFWIILFVMDKVYQTKFVEDVYVGHRQPPSLAMVPLHLVALESLSFLVVFVLLLVAERRFRNTINTFIVDDVLLMQVVTDYAVTTPAILLICQVIVTVVCSPALRYGHDGMRGIRSAYQLCLYASALVLAIPAFLAY